MVAMTILSIGIAPVILAYRAATFIIEGLQGAPSRYSNEDSVWLTDMSSVTGTIVRVVDWGVIFAVPGNSPVFFLIPKEQIRKLEFRK